MTAAGQVVAAPWSHDRVQATAFSRACPVAFGFQGNKQVGMKLP